MFKYKVVLIMADSNKSQAIYFCEDVKATDVVLTLFNIESANKENAMNIMLHSVEHFYVAENDILE